jgi:hypothetical protein
MSPVRDGMSVENIPHPVSNPVRDDMSVTADDGRTAYGVSSLTGFFRENDLFFYRHPGGVSKVLCPPPVETGGYSWATPTALNIYDLRS